jgi:hypothetical protein
MSDSGRPVRFTADPSALSVPVGSIDVAWPHRQKEVLAEINKALGGIRTINAAHVLSVRRAYDVEANGDFCYTQKHASPRYSQAFVVWILDEFEKDGDFFEKAKAIADQRRNAQPSM